MVCGGEAAGGLPDTEGQLLWVSSGSAAGPCPTTQASPWPCCPQGQKGQPGDAIHPAPEGPPPPAWLPASLGTCVPQSTLRPWEGAGGEGDSPSRTPAGPPDRVTAGRPGAQRPAGWACAPRGAGGWGPSWKDAPHRPPLRRGQVTSLLLARRRSVRRGPRRSLACARHAPDAEGMTHAKPRLQLRDHRQRGRGEP